MAQVHPNATITPTKLEIARDWLVDQPWFAGDSEALDSPRRFSYRFDDPVGEVGVEVLLVRDGEHVLQVPLTYRAAKRDGDGYLTDMIHTVLGQRFIYDGLTDPVFVAAHVDAILTGAEQEDFEVGDVVHPAVVKVRGTGSGESAGDLEIRGIERNGPTTEVHTSAGDLVFPHVLGTLELDGRPGLVGRWPDGPETVLAVLGARR